MRWATAIRLLARHVPTDRPVEVRRVRKLAGCVAYCQRDDDRYLVRVARDRPTTMLDGLAHEWAHAAAWGASRIDHGAAWAKAYARAYRVIFDGWRPACR